MAFIFCATSYRIIAREMSNSENPVVFYVIYSSVSGRVFSRTSSVYTQRRLKSWKTRHVG